MAGAAFDAGVGLDPAVLVAVWAAGDLVAPGAAPAVGTRLVGDRVLFGRNSHRLAGAAGRRVLDVDVGRTARVVGLFAVS